MRDEQLHAFQDLVVRNHVGAELPEEPQHLEARVANRELLRRILQQRGDLHRGALPAARPGEAGD